jgi:stage V sporulation protein AB
MSEFFSYLVLLGIGLGSGMFVSGAVFAFITVVGIVPRFAQKTRTQNSCRFYESAISLGGIFGAVAIFMQLRTPLGAFVLAFLSLCAGIFYGSLAMSLAEVLDVFPILARRGRVQRGIFFFVLAIALGKAIGSLLYFLIPGFYDAGSM